MDSYLWELANVTMFAVNMEAQFGYFWGLALASNTGIFYVEIFFWPFWAVPSLLFAPLACVISMKIAHRRGLGILYYGLLGALYSIAYLLPWIYLITRMSGRRMPRKLIISGYVAIYVNWIATFYGLLFFFFQSGRYKTIGELTVWALLAVFWIVVVAYTWHLVHMDRRRTDPYCETKRPSTQYTHVPKDLVYLTPFLLTLVGQVMCVVLIIP